MSPGFPVEPTLVTPYLSITFWPLQDVRYSAFRVPISGTLLCLGTLLWRHSARQSWPVLILNSTTSFLGFWLTFFGPVFLHILPCFSSRLIKDNISFEFEDFHQGKFFLSLNEGQKTSLRKFGSMLCKGVCLFVSLDSYIRGDPLQ